MELFIKAIAGGLLQGAATVGKVALIVVPLIILMELAHHYKLLDFVQGRVGGLMRFLKLPPRAAFPLLIGIFFGLLYGAALIIDCVREGHLTTRDVTVLIIFLSLNHSMIEDTALFTAIGGNPMVMLLFRLLTAIVITRLAAYILDFRASRSHRLEKTKQGD